MATEQETVSDDEAPSVSPRPEAVAAAAWWASRLGRGSAHIGSPADPSARENTAFALGVTALANRTFTEEQVTAFRRELEVTIEEHLARWDHAWKPDEPQWGSALRSFGVDYGGDPCLKDAAIRAGFQLRTLDLPLKTTMQMNPGVVRVAEGYGADYVTIWEAPA